MPIFYASLTLNPPSKWLWLLHKDNSVAFEGIFDGIEQHSDHIYLMQIFTDEVKVDVNSQECVHISVHALAVKTKVHMFEKVFEWECCSIIIGGYLVICESCNEPVIKKKSPIIITPVLQLQ